MKDYIAVAKNIILNFVDSLLTVVPNLPLRIAFVGYRDHNETDQRFAVFPFSTDIAALKSFVANQKATTTGDCDFPEDVLGGLNVSCALQWSSSLRMLYHIADAPCHGNEFHTPDILDNYPAGDPLGLIAVNLLRNLQSKNIEYFFGKINDDDQSLQLSSWNQLC
jgi:hypothetical protein